MTCIFSILKFVEHQTKKLEIMTSVITFNQPLWINAFEIIEAKSLNIVCMLDGFHLLMSFLRSIGAVMKGGGLEEAWKLVSMLKTQSHTSSLGKLSQEPCEYFLAEYALVNKLIAPLIDRSGNDEEDKEANNEVDQYEEYILEDSEKSETVHIADLEVELESFSKGLDEDIVFHTELYPTIAKLQDILDDHKDVLNDSSRAAKL